LQGLSFLDSNIEKVVAQTNEVLDSMPKAGWIEGANLANLARWTLVMSNPDMLKNHASNEFLLEEEPEVIVDDFGVLGETVSTSLDEDLTVFESEPEQNPDPLSAEISVDNSFGVANLDQEQDDFSFGLGF
jgi:hypothetical protein